MASKANVLYEVLRQNRADAIDLSSRVGKVRLTRILEKADADLSRRLAATARVKGGAGKASFTAEDLRVTLMHVRDVTRTVKRGLTSTLLETGSEAADRATGHLIDYMGKADEAFRGVGSRPLALKEAAILEQAVSGTETTILRRLASSGEPGTGTEPHPAKLGILERYGVETVGKFEDVLQLGLVARKPWSEVRSDLVDSSPFLQGAPQYWAERIVRTETMGIYNRAGWEGMRAANEQLEDMARIVAAVFDDRTGWDSYQYHGQIRRTEEPFHSQMGAYMYPPNRPNDRETVVPHRIAWPIPPQLAWRTPEEVAARFRMEGRKGSPPPRPLMTTIPLDRFGKQEEARGD